MDATAMARLLNEISGGIWSHPAEQQTAKAVLGIWPRLPGALARFDRFRSEIAADAVARGMSAIVFGSAGFPCGDPPHLAAARASGSARFFYPQRNKAIAGQRALQLDGDARARVLPVSVRDAAGLVRAVTGACGGGPWQVQWGLAAMALDCLQARGLARDYGELLPPGSEIVIAVPDGAEGTRFATLAGGWPHTAGDLGRWCTSAGFELACPVADVRAWGRQALGCGLPEAGGRIVAAVARKP